MSVIDIQFPGNLAQVAGVVELRAVPSTYLLDGAAYLAGDAGFFLFDVDSLAADDGSLVLKPNDRTPLQAGRWKLSGGGSFATGASVTALAASLATATSDISTINASRGVSVLDFIPKAKWAGIKAGTNTDDLTAYFQAAAVACRTSLPNSDQEGAVFIPNGRYHLNRVGIRGVLFHGESTGGTELRAFSAGSSGQFMMDAMYDTDGTTFNTVGGGWCVGLTIDGRLPNSETKSGRSGMRTYGGAQTIERVRIRYCNYGLAVGLPIWTTVKNVLTLS